MRKIKISAIQFKLRKIRHFSDFENHVTGCLEGVADSDFVIFPELFTMELLSTLENSNALSIKDFKNVSRYTDKYLKLFSRISSETGQYIVAGSHLVEDNGRFFNTSFMFQPNGVFVEHRKTHVFPMERKWDTSEGDDLRVVKTDKANVGISICYENQVPEVSRILTLKGAEIIFCPSWTSNEYGFWRVRNSCQARCIENQIYMTHCSLVGSLDILDLKGWGNASILTPCHEPWKPNGVLESGEPNRE
ncbi:MAG: nitrilase-related carbon-nitrogen hydrolase, partial [Candidatus Bathyarchaeia archaeon]